MIALGYGFAFSFFTALVVILGDYLIKLAADAGQSALSIFVLAGVGLYAVSALLWFFALHHISLSHRRGVAFSMLSLLALCAIGALYFGEEFHMREYAGIGCALLAMVLMVRVA